MMCPLKSQFTQNLIIINYKSNGDFNSHIILEMTQEELVEITRQHNTCDYHFL
jgi:hypothetical protein